MSLRTWDSRESRDSVVRQENRPAKASIAAMAANDATASSRRNQIRDGGAPISIRGSPADVMVIAGGLAESQRTR